VFTRCDRQNGNFRKIFPAFLKLSFCLHRCQLRADSSCRSFSGGGSESGSAASRSTLNFFPPLGRTHRGGDAFPLRRQAGKIVGDSGEIAIDRS
jgi:hypothetical protein